MRQMIVPVLWSAALCLSALTACGGADDQPPAPGDAAYPDDLAAALQNARPGDVIDIPPGRFTIKRPLDVTVDGVTVRGAGMKKTILSFRKQTSAQTPEQTPEQTSEQAAEQASEQIAAQASATGSLHITANDVTVEDLAIEDTPGPGLTVNDARNIALKGIRTEWTDGTRTENGAYGISLVTTENILVENNVTIGASHAGIHISQSRNAVVRGNRTENNVAGIEIENTSDADIYKNFAVNNVSGVLVINKPMTDIAGTNTRIFRNRIVKNNLRNFAPADSLVRTLPAGSGVIIRGYDLVEIFENEISGNKTANIIITSGLEKRPSRMAAEASGDSSFNLYPEGIFIHDNVLGGGGTSPDGIDLQALKTLKFGLTGALPDVLWDGVAAPVRPADAPLPEALRICVDNGPSQVMNLDAANDYKEPTLALRTHECRLDPLAPVTLTGPLADE